MYALRPLVVNGIAENRKQKMEESSFTYINCQLHYIFKREQEIIMEIRNGYCRDKQSIEFLNLWNHLEGDDVRRLYNSTRFLDPLQNENIALHNLSI